MQTLLNKNLPHYFLHQPTTLLSSLASGTDHASMLLIQPKIILCFKTNSLGLISGLGFNSAPQVQSCSHPGRFKNHRQQQGTIIKRIQAHWEATKPIWGAEYSYAFPEYRLLRRCGWKRKQACM
jgi:hypothetical protein